MTTSVQTTDHTHIHTRQQLKACDPGLAKLCDEAMRQRAIQTANCVTYDIQPDNRIVVGFQYLQ